MTLPPLNANSLKSRALALRNWFSELLPQLQGGVLQDGLQPVSGDASFRRYFRAVTAKGSWILVDAPPDREDSRPFVAVAARLAAGGVVVPEVLAADFDRGFMCLSDFGDVLLWNKLDDAQHFTADSTSPDLLYQSAFAELLKIQQCEALQAPLPLFDSALLLREMRLFSEWFCAGLMGQPLSAEENALLENTYTFLAEAALAQPQVFVHRDYHSRNLMYREAQAPGVLDFQDAVLGPVTYDLVSLLKDCYIVWPRAQVNAWALDYAEQARAAGILSEVAPERFLRDFDLMGAQRHIKVLGIFSRLWLRDGKSGYLRDIPRTMDYLVTVVAEHPQLADFAGWLQTRVLPELKDALARVAQDRDSAGAPA